MRISADPARTHGCGRLQTPCPQAGGVVLFDEPVKPATLIGIALVIIGVVVMYVGGGMEH